MIKTPYTTANSTQMFVLVYATLKQMVNNGYVLVSTAGGDPSSYWIKVRGKIR